MYYRGQSEIPVKPVSRRLTFTRGMPERLSRRYLQRAGRKPLNRIGYPTMGTPVAVDLSMQPGHFGGEPDDAFSMKGLNPLSTNSPVVIAAQTRSGLRVLTRPYDPFSSVALGQSIFDKIAPLVSTYTPSIPSVVAAPAPSTVWSPINSLVRLWNERPQVLKDMRFTVNPQQVMQAAQSVVRPGQVSGFVDQLNRWGLNPSYRGAPITGPMAGYGYQAAGVNWSAYLPWIAGGAALLFVVPMLMKKTR